MSASGVPIDQLGSFIQAHIRTAEKYIGKTEENYKSAGMHLIEAKERIAEGEYGGDFLMFLKFACKGLSSSRAYELIAIANGTTTIEAQRQRAREGMQQSRARAWSLAEIAKLRREMEKEQAKAAAERAEAESRSAIARAKATPIQDASKVEEEKIARQIASVCGRLTLADLRDVLALAVERSKINAAQKVPA